MKGKEIPVITTLNATSFGTFNPRNNIKNQQDTIIRKQKIELFFANDIVHLERLTVSTKSIKVMSVHECAGRNFPLS